MPRQLSFFKSSQGPKGFSPSPLAQPYPYPIGSQTSILRALEWAVEEWRSRGLSESTIDAYSTYVRQLASFLEVNTPVGEVTEENIRAFKAYLASRRPPLKPRSRKLAVLAVRAFFTLLHQAKRIPHNPALKIYPDPVPLESPRILSPAQWQRVLQAALEKGTFAYLAVLLAGELGLRTGEIFRLTWDDIDLQDPYAPRVKILYDRPFHSWKNRVVQGTKMLSEVLKDYREEFNGGKPAPMSRLCPYESIRSLKQLFSDLGREAKLPFPLTGSALRWQAIWKSYANGLRDPKKLSQRFGLSMRHLEQQVLPVLRKLERQESPA